ncbi:TRAPP trafficking subunit Trs65-domain-containing protein [Boeremia exigua]|uniref:TRAPP trafficking subunit Trs65-domain-containing protein n=1 Tax=Boeremia exigua TaxID=749465 RepID=UPI001E8EB446|nr:TRAPP trafficking subunit Trs65-domain-containing protein [Boeremia exigua]KAH6615282.1 TRAPP trafficking subunit Trs65-domain-containing protein [Boeremia exigua]
MGSEEQPRASFDFAESSLLEAIAPAASDIDIEDAFNSWDGSVEDEDASVVPFVKQRHVLLFGRLDELLPVYVVFRTPLLEDEALKTYLDRLAVHLDVYAFGTAPGPDQETKPLPKELLFAETIQDTNEPTIVLHESGDAKHAYVFWKVNVSLARPQGRFHKPAIYFQPSASLKPGVTAKRDEVQDDYLPSRVPPALNLLQSFEHDPALAGIHPRLSAMRISKIAPSAPLARETARPIKTGQRPLFRVVPPLMWRTRFAKVHTSLADLSLMASLDIEVAQYTSYKVRITKVELLLKGGEIKALTSLDPSTAYSPGDQLGYLYKATPDLSADGAPALGSKGHILTVNISADVLISATCQPHVAIQWKTTVDFATDHQPALLKAAHRLSSASLAGSIKSPDALPAHDTHDPAAPDNAISLTLTISGPPRVRVGALFTWTVFVVNRSNKPRRLAVTVVPQRPRDAARPQSSASTGDHGASHSVSHGATHSASHSVNHSAKPPLLAPAVLDDHIIYGRHKSAQPHPTRLVCLTTDIRLGALGPGACYTAELQFVALAAGALAVEAVRVVDLASGEVADVRELPGGVAVGGGGGE